jgi:hypothetical protein
VRWAERDVQGVADRERKRIVPARRSRQFHFPITPRTPAAAVIDDGRLDLGRKPVVDRRDVARVEGAAIEAGAVRGAAAVTAERVDELSCAWFSGTSS